MIEQPDSTSTVNLMGARSGEKIEGLSLFGMAGS